MKIYNDQEITADEVNMEGAKDVKMRILIGPRDGSDNVVMRQFIVAPGGHTPHHTHDFEHVVKVMAGVGTVLDADEKAHEVKPGQSLFIPANEKHQFQNNGTEPFEFLCIIVGPGK